MPKSKSAGDRYWIENQYVIVNMYLKRVNNKTEYSPHNVSNLWALKNYFVCRQKCKIHKPPRPLAGVSRTLDNSSATPLYIILNISRNNSNERPILD